MRVGLLGCSAVVMLVLFAALMPGAGISDAGGIAAGAATVELRPPHGVPLGGYGAMARRRVIPGLFDASPAFWFRESVGTLEGVMARALLIEAPRERVLWISIDLVAVDDSLVSDLTARLAASGLTYSAVIVSASHTHSGPGAFVDSALFGMLALDRLNESVRESLLGGLVEAATRAERAKTPALVGVGTAAAPAIVRSRLGRALDQEIVLFKFVRRDRSPVALLWNFAIHGTVLGPRNLKLSGDVMGIASRAIEARVGAVALFVNGAVGDVSPAGHGERAALELGERLADTVIDGWGRIAVDDRASVVLARERVELGAPFVSPRNCLGGWAPAFATLPLGDALPSAIELTAVRVGQGVAVTVPGELQTSLGLGVKRAGRGRFGAVAIAGLSNGYVGYLLAREDYGRPHYVSCSSLYGEGAGERVAAAATALLERVASAAGTSPAATPRTLPRATRTLPRATRTSPRTARAPAAAPRGSSEASYRTT